MPYLYLPTTCRNSLTTLSSCEAASEAEIAPSASCSLTWVVTLIAIASFWLLFDSDCQFLVTGGLIMCGFFNVQRCADHLAEYLLH